MNVLGRQSWLGVMLAVGILYGAVGIVFAFPSNNVHMWRLAAWVGSAAIYVIHIGYEHFRLGNSSLATASHAATAVALGAFILAGAATIHKAVATSHAPYSRYMLALVIWPIVTAVPAFLVALVAGALLAIRRSA